MCTYGNFRKFASSWKILSSLLISFSLTLSLSPIYTQYIYFHNISYITITAVAFSVFVILLTILIYLILKLFKIVS